MSRERERESEGEEEKVREKRETETETERGTERVRRAVGEAVHDSLDAKCASWSFSVRTTDVRLAPQARGDVFDIEP